MPDISMCQGLNVSTNTMCPKRNTCYRFTATPSEFWQSYFTDAPFTTIRNKHQCDYLIEVQNKVKTILIGGAL